MDSFFSGFMLVQSPSHIPTTQRGEAKISSDDKQPSFLLEQKLAYMNRSKNGVTAVQQGMSVVNGAR